MPLKAGDEVLVTGMEMWWQEAIAELKSQHRFGIVATSIGGRAALNLALLPMVWWWGLDGAYLRWILLMTLVLAWTWARNPVRGRPRFDREIFGQILFLCAFGYESQVENSVSRCFGPENHDFGRRSPSP